MKYFLSILLPLLPILAYSQSDTCIIQYPLTEELPVRSCYIIAKDTSDKRLCEGKMENMVKSGRWVYYSGEKHITGYYSEGIPSNKWQVRWYWYSCGSISDTVTRSCNSIQVRDTFVIEGAGDMKSGKKTGTWYFFSDSTFEYGPYRRGCRHGQWVEFGPGKSEGEYRKGKKHGSWFTHYSYCSPSGSGRRSSYYYYYKKGKIKRPPMHINWR